MMVMCISNVFQDSKAKVISNHTMYIFGMTARRLLGVFIGLTTSRVNQWGLLQMFLGRIFREFEFDWVAFHRFSMCLNQNQCAYGRCATWALDWRISTCLTWKTTLHLPICWIHEPRSQSVERYGMIWTEMHLLLVLKFGVLFRASSSVKLTWFPPSKNWTYFTFSEDRPSHRD